MKKLERNSEEGNEKAEAAGESHHFRKRQAREAGPSSSV